MDNKISIVFLCIFLFAAFIIGYIMINSLNNQLNNFKQQINITSSNLPNGLSGIESEPGITEPDDENALNE